MALIDELRAKHGNKGVNPPEGQASAAAPEKIKTAEIKREQGQADAAVMDRVFAPASDDQILAACLRALLKRLG